jgi:hypothetical protein
MSGPSIADILNELVKAERRALALKRQLIAKGYTGQALLSGRSDGWSFRGSSKGREV